MKRLGVPVLVGACLVLLSSAPRGAAADPLRGLKQAVGNFANSFKQRVNNIGRRPGFEPGVVPRYVLEEVIARNSNGRGDPSLAKAARETLERTPSCDVGILGRIANRIDQALTPLKRRVYDCNLSYKLPGTLELSDGANDQQSDVASAHRANDALKAFYDLNKDLGYDAMKITGDSMDISVRYGPAYDNAYYDGSKMVLGSGNPKGLFKDLSHGADVVYHEAGHGMTRTVLNPDVKVTLRDKLSNLFRGVRNTIRLDYYGQSGALNESISDIYGVMGMQYTAGMKIADAKEENWLIGRTIMNESIQAPEGHKACLRNMLFPGQAYDDPKLGKDRQPAHMKDIYTGSDDNNGVHINSGIPNRAFVLASIEYAKSNPNATTMTTGKVWLSAMTKIGTSANFQEAANAIYQTALDAKDTKMAECFAKGWSEVGVTVGTASTMSQRAARSMMRGAIP